jgi:hypothetical protein
MSARIVELSRVLASRAAADPGVGLEPETQQFQFWGGASGQQYVHSVFSLIGCPEVPASNYILARRHADGQLTVLRIGRVEHSAPSLNLAEIRHRGAKLGANEVHVHFLAGSQGQRRSIETDLRVAHFTGHQAQRAESGQR